MFENLHTHRFTSHFDMYDSILKNWDTLNGDVGKNIEIEPLIDKIKYEILSKTTQILQIFSESVMLLEQNKQTTIDKSLPVLEKLLSACEIIEESSEDGTVTKDPSAIRIFKSNLRKYIYDKLKPAFALNHAMGSILNPLFRYSF